MTRLLENNQALQSSDGDRLRQRLSSLGFTVALVGADGRFLIQGEAQPIERMFARCKAFKAAIREQYDWLRDCPGQAVAVWPGVWLVAMAVQRRRRRETETLIPVAVVLGQELPYCEQLHLLCDELHQDHRVTVGKIDKERLHGDRQVEHTAQIIAWMREDITTVNRGSRELQSITRELADSYEELSMLYKLSCSMTFNQPVEDFLREACHELQQVAGLTWMALYLDETTGRPDHLNGLTVTSGIAEAERATFKRIGGELLDHETALHTPTVYEDPTSLDIAELSERASCLLVVPIQFDDTPIGVLFGGDKLDQTTITSNDAKLCSSLANGLSIFLQNTLLYEDMGAMFMGTLKALTVSIDAKDSYTLGHTERVAMLSRQLADAMGLDERMVERIYLSGLMHDVGKIGVPEAVLAKPGKLTVEEFDLIKMHPEIGERILRDIPQMTDLIPGVLSHHERWDGGGYPHGLKEKDIPLFGRVICLADAFDAMSSNRTYRDALPHEEVMEQIRTCKGSQFDPRLTDVFLTLDFSEYFALAKKHKEEAALKRA